MKKLCLLLACLCTFSLLHGQIISTIAGIGTIGYSGDGGPATAAQLFSPCGVGVDTIGNVYFAERDNNVIRKVNTAGIITTFAGTGMDGFSGDGGPATAAKLSMPYGLAVDSYGNVYYSDRGANKIRKINVSGIITTIAGNGTTISSGDGGPATSAGIAGPTGICFDTSGNTYIAESGGCKIRKINSSGIISTVAGNGVYGYSGDGGPATNASMASPYSMLIDSAGNLYIPDVYNSRIREVSTSGIISTFAGIGTVGADGDCGPATAASLGFTVFIIADNSGNIIFTTPDEGRIRKVLPSGYISTYAGTGILGASGDGGPASAAGMQPLGITMDRAGNIYFADFMNSRIRKITAHTDPVTGPVNGSGVVCQGGTITLTDTTTGGIWLSSDTAIAIVNSSSGAVTGIHGGTTIIRYEIGCGIFAAHALTVIPAPHISGVSGLCSIGISATLTSDSAGGIWSSSNPFVATISPLGVITSHAAGNAIISYSLPSSCGILVATKTVGVDTFSPVITVCPVSPYVCEFSTVTLSATPGGGIWSSSSISEASVAPSGVVMGFTAGTTDLTYTYTNFCGTDDSIMTLTVTPYLDAAFISGPTVVCAGASVTLFDYGATYPGTWSSDDPTIVTIDTNGIATGISGGSATISYTISNACGTVAATYSLYADPASYPGTISGTPFICLGTPITLHNSTPGGIWSSSSPIATVSGGVVTAFSVGHAIISYSVTSSACGTVSDTMLITINNGPPVAGIITGMPILCAGTATTLSSSVAGGAWSSSSAIAAVSGGILTGINAGNAIISYTVINGCGTATDTMLITVNPLPYAGTITGMPIVCEGAMTTLANLAAAGIWSSGSPNATIAGGTVTGVSAGSAIISYSTTNSCGTATDTMMVTVNPLPQAGTITGSPVVCAGAITSLGNSATGGIWSSSSPAAGIAGGIVTGVSAGIAIISYSVTNSCGTATDTMMITVNPLPDAGTITGPSFVCVGAATIFANAATGGTWSSSNASMVVTGGVVTGVAAGSTTLSYNVINSCGTAATSKDITVIAVPRVDSIAGPDHACEGDVVSLTDSITGGAWSSTNTTIATIDPAGSLKALTAGTTTISYEISNNCGVATTAHAIRVVPLDDCSGVHGVFNIFPNPTESSFLVELPESDPDVMIAIMDVTGKILEVLRPNTTSKKIRVYMENLPKAVYPIKVVANGKTYVAKLVLR